MPDGAEAAEEASAAGPEPPNATPGAQAVEAPVYVEMSPNGRFGRYAEVLGTGSFKTVYKAFDEEDGIEVAWNQVKLRNVEEREKNALMMEVETLKRLEHPNIIRFYDSWTHANDKSASLTVNFITELCGATLRDYTKVHKKVDVRAIKNWSRQILKGLAHMHHTMQPPVIHRDVKLDNIFINGNSGDVKIGDLGLARTMGAQKMAHTCVGTPEYMAPELYEESYDTKVDIYSFGLCVLELETHEFPYSECDNMAQIYKKVSQKILPASLEKLTNPEMKRFVMRCLSPQEVRPDAWELLEDEFLKKENKLRVSSSTELPPPPPPVKLGSGAAAAAAAEAETPAEVDAGGPSAPHPLAPDGPMPPSPTEEAPAARAPSPVPAAASPHAAAPAAPAAAAPADAEALVCARNPETGAMVCGPAPAAALAEAPAAAGEAPLPQPLARTLSSEPSSFVAHSASGEAVRVKGQWHRGDASVKLRLKVKTPAGAEKTVEFPFLLTEDTAEGVAREMVAELELSAEENFVANITEQIRCAVAPAVDWQEQGAAAGEAAAAAAAQAAAQPAVARVSLGGGGGSSGALAGAGPPSGGATPSATPLPSSAGSAASSRHPSPGRDSHSRAPSPAGYADRLQRHVAEAFTGTAQQEGAPQQPPPPERAARPPLPPAAAPSREPSPTGGAVDRAGGGHLRNASLAEWHITRPDSAGGDGGALSPSAAAAPAAAAPAAAAPAAAAPAVTAPPAAAHVAPQPAPPAEVPPPALPPKVHAPPAGPLPVAPAVTAAALSPHALAAVPHQDAMTTVDQWAATAQPPPPAATVQWPAPVGAPATGGITRTPSHDSLTGRQPESPTAAAAAAAAAASAAAFAAAAQGSIASTSLYTASEASSDGVPEAADAAALGGQPLDADEAAALEKKNSVLRQLEQVESELKALAQKKAAGGGSDLARMASSSSLASSTDNIAALAHAGGSGGMAASTAAAHAPPPVAVAVAPQPLQPPQQPPHPQPVTSPSAHHPVGSTSPPLPAAPHAEGGRASEVRASEVGGVRLSTEAFNAAGLGLPPKGGGPPLASLGPTQSASAAANGHHAGPGVAVSRTASDQALPRRSEAGGEPPASSAEGRAKSLAETLDLALNKQLSDLSKSNALISGLGMKSGGGEMLKREPSSVTAAVVAAAAAQHAAEGVLGQSGRHDPKLFRSSGGMGAPSGSMAHLADALAPKPQAPQAPPQVPPPHVPSSLGAGAFAPQQQAQAHPPAAPQQAHPPPPVGAPQMPPLAPPGAPPHVSHLAPPPSVHPAVPLPPPQQQHLAPPQQHPPPLPPHPAHPPPHAPGPSHH